MTSYRISLWLISWFYPLASHIVLPLYFRRLTVVGQENIPKSGPVIVAPTHRSRWDAVIVPYAVGQLVSGRDLVHGDGKRDAELSGLANPAAGGISRRCGTSGIGEPLLQRRTPMSRRNVGNFPGRRNNV